MNIISIYHVYYCIVFLLHVLCPNTSIKKTEVKKYLSISLDLSGLSHLCTLPMDPIDPRKKTEMKNISPSLSISPVSHISLYSPYFISLDLSGGSGSGAGVRRAAASMAGPAGAHRRGGGLKLPSSLPPSLSFLPPSLPRRRGSGMAYPPPLRSAGPPPPPDLPLPAATKR